MIRPIPAIMILTSASVFAGEWSDIDLKTPLDWRQKLGPIIAKQLKLEKVAVVESFRFNDWSIVHVGAYVDDDRFLFYKGDPFKNNPVTEWGGATGSDETNEIKDWAIENAKGIPNHLAAYFAWRVTKGPS